MPFIYEYIAIGLFIYEQHDSNNQLTKQVIFSERGNSTDPQYHADPLYVGAPTNILPDDVVEAIGLEYQYDPQDRLTAIIGENNQQINVDYNGDRISRVWFTSPEGVRDVTYTYNNGRLDTATSSSGHVTQYTYVETDPNSGLIDTVLDQTRGESLVDVDSDLESRSNKTTAQGNAALITTTAYDRNSGIMQTTDTLGRVSTVQRDILNQNRLQMISREAMNSSGVPQTLSTSYAYDPGNPLAGPVTVTDIRNNQTLYTYDSTGNITSITDALNRTTTFERGVDTADNLRVIVVTDPKGRKSANKYDKVGRLVASCRRITIDTNGQQPDPGTSPADYYNFTFSCAGGYVKTFNYDAATGDINSVTSDGLSAQYDWIAGNETVQITQRNSFGQAEVLTSAAGYDTQYQYDGLTRLKSVQGPADAAPTTLQYYTGGLQQDRVSSVTTAVGGTTQVLDVKNRVQSVADSRGVVTTYINNINNQLERVVEVSPDGGTVLTTQYFYDDFGKLDHKLLPNGSRVNYSYDGFDRLTGMIELEGGDASSSNNAPVIGVAPGPMNTVTAGGTFSFDMDASDADGDSRSYALVKAPDGMTIDPTTGMISWIPGAEQIGEHVIVVEVSDGNGGIDTVTFVIVVDDSVGSTSDNCTDVPNPDQLDSDGDGYGNRCDPDLNNDGDINFADLAAFKAVYGTTDANADFDGSGIVDDADLEILKSMFGGPPGPSGVVP